MRKRYSRSYTVLSFLTMFSYREQPFDGPFCMLFLFLFSGCRNGLSHGVCLPLLHLGVGKAEFLLEVR